MKYFLCVVFFLALVVASPGMADQLILKNGVNSYSGQVNVQLQSGYWGSAGYTEPGYISYTGAMYFAHAGGSNEARNLVKFDLQNQLPQDAVITSACLEFVSRRAPNVSDIQVAAFQAFQPWTSGDTYWENWGNGGEDFGYYNVNSPEGSVVIAQTVLDVATYKIPLSPEMIQDWVDNPITNYGLLLRQIEATSWSTIFMFGTDVAEHSPELIITYEIIPDPLSSPTVLFKNGYNGYSGQVNAQLQAGYWGAAGYTEPGYLTYTGSMFFGHNGGSNEARSLLKFDLQDYSFPQDAIITSATLKLVSRRAPDVSDITLGVFQAFQPWTPGDTYWTNWGNGGEDSGYYDESSPDGSIVIPMTALDIAAYEIPLNVDMVQSWIDDPSCNYGVLLRQIEDPSWTTIFLYASDGDVYNTKLTITYETPDPLGLSRGHRILLKKGLQILAMLFPNEYNTAQPFSIARFNMSNFTTLDFVDGPLQARWMDSIPGRLWARQSHGTDGILQDQELPYLESLVSLKFRDEQPLFPAMEYKTAFDYCKANYPGVINMTNHYGSQYSFADLQTFLAYARPDMVMFDTYPFSGNLAGGSPTNFYRDLEKYRQLGLLGLDGSGSQPIPIALYLQTYTETSKMEHVASESEIRLNQFAAWAFGCTFADAFVYISPTSNMAIKSVLFTGLGDSVSTERFDYVSETNRQSRNLGPALIRLITTDVRMLMGKHSSEKESWEIWLPDSYSNSVPDGVTVWTPDADPYITGIGATNLGTLNDGYKGDVLVGYFKPLHESFDGESYCDQQYFMIVNGLTDSNGNALSTRQRIRLNFDFASSGMDSLQRMRRSDGQVETVELVSDGGSLYHLDLELDGGTGDLFKFNTGADFVGGNGYYDDALPVLDGDANLDGSVDVGDLGILAANYGTAVGATWAMGDFNDDGAVDVGDLGILAANYGSGSTAAADFDTDYAKVFGSSFEDNSEAERTTMSCSELGLPLVAGVFILGLMFIKLEK